MHDFSEMKIKKIEKELIEDIESDLVGWSMFIPTDDNEEILQHRNEIRQKIVIFKKLIDR